jgi:hypothetical protein
MSLDKSDDDDGSALELPLKEPRRKRTKEEKLAYEREQLFRGVVGGEFDVLNQRIAWILNNYPETRDSDIKLQLRYWTHFEKWDGGPISPGELFERARLTSLSRGRAYIQNTHNLFLASPEIRKRRGKLSEEERQKAIEQRPSYPLLAVYADESGKGADNLIVASAWFLHTPETLPLLLRIAQWRAERRFDSELHFTSIRKADLPLYKEFVDLVLATAASISFKAISVSRHGIGRIDEALDDLYYFLLLRGAEHEAETGRAPLPRTIQLWKDLEEKGRDKLLLARLAEELAQSGTTRFDGQLTVDEFEAVPSDELVLLQIADLYAGSLNRSLNAPGEKRGPKDDFAEYMLGRVGTDLQGAAPQDYKDMSVQLQL